MSEADLKRTVADYLNVLQNQGKLMFLRLNAGSFILTDKDGNFRRRVQGVKAGTADFIVIRSCFEKSCIQRIVDFIELKSERGKQTKEQKEFQELAENNGCGYYIIRTLEELQLIISQA